MTLLTRVARRLIGRAGNTPEMRAWRHACREAGRVPRRTPGRIRLADYDIAYADLLTLCPQWHDLFVRGTLDVMLPTPTPVILDCGANVGMASLLFKRRHPGARIRAFEADPDLAATLRDNLQRNGAADVDVMAAAVWTHNGTVEFRQEGADSGAIAGCAGTSLAGLRTTVPCVRLRDILEAGPVDLLKIDIEGAEAAVLVDCASALENVHAVAVEVHDVNRASRRLPGVLDVLTGAGFTWTLDQLLPVATPAQEQTSPPFRHAADAWVVLVKGWRAR